MAKIPNLYLKWGVFRALFPDDRSDAVFAQNIFPDVATPETAFTKLKYGETGCQGRTAEKLAFEINEFLRRHRQDRGVAALFSSQFSPPDLSLPVYQFIRLLIDLAGEVSQGQLAAANSFLIKALTAGGEENQNPNLVIEKIQMDRGWKPYKKDDDDGMEPSDNKTPVKFDPSHHLGSFAIKGVTGEPAAVYVFEIRNPHPLGKHLWEFDWHETVNWVPSPFQPQRKGDLLLITRGPVRIHPVTGRFHLSAVVALDKKILAKLDPREEDAKPARLDEVQTARFLTNVKRLARSDSPVRVFSNIYDVMGDAT
jgi:hypothetical protein